MEEQHRAEARDGNTGNKGILWLKNRNTTYLCGVFNKETEGHRLVPKAQRHLAIDTVFVHLHLDIDKSQGWINEGFDNAFNS